jgi:hypothetical protein
VTHGCCEEEGHEQGQEEGARQEEGGQEEEVTPRDRQVAQLFCKS